MKPHRRMRRGGRAERGARPAKVPPPGELTGMDVVLVGYFSAKERHYLVIMDEFASAMAALGAQVVGRFVQRRGVSDGGARTMDAPYSSRTLVSAGKVEEIALVREKTRADAVIFLNPLTAHQVETLTGLFNCPVLSSQDLVP
ncbi:hypothetical protein ABZT47_23365 [Sphaerisporangium sp. NPDC005289]|uniref:HflX-like GTP-binding protein n=1 Tax=Sphaerisporangium sp. NPDC005289 TaxID=3155247 RepID=UPI0033A195EB